MTREEAIAYFKDMNECTYGNVEPIQMAIKALEQEPCEDIEEIREVMSCDADAENKCKMISNILTAKSHYFKK